MNRKLAFLHCNLTKGRLEYDENDESDSYRGKTRI